MKHPRLRRYLRHGTLTQLSVFEAIVRHGSFTRAAEELCLAQPTVSIQMKKLSETVGLPLLEHVGRTIKLTVAGEELSNAFRSILQNLYEFDSRVARLRSKAAAPKLKVAGCTTAEYFAPCLLGRFAQQCPDADPGMTIVSRDQLLQRLDENIDDFYICSQLPRRDDIQAQPIMPNRICVYARADHPWGARSGVPLAEIAAASLLMRERGSGTRIAADALFESHALVPRIRFELGSNEALKQAAAAGLGLAILSEHAVGADAGRCGLKQIDVTGFPLELQWLLVHRSDKPLSQCAEQFLEFARLPEHAKPAAAAGRAVPA
jgi:DNA-binding transcriptional LysR family regulator